MIIRTPAELITAVSYLADNAAVIYFDFETTGLDPYSNRILLLALRGAERTYVIDFLALDLTYLSYIKPLLEDPGIVKVAHNAVFDWKFLFHRGIYTAPVHCTMITEQVLKAGLITRGYSLADVSLRRLGIEMDKSTREGFINRDVNIPFTEEELRYAGNDVDVLEPIYYQQLEEIKRENLQKVYDLECALIPITSKMEHGGVCIDTHRLQEAYPVIEAVITKASKSLQDELIRNGAAESILFDKDGYLAVNTGSPLQMREAFNSIGIDVRSLGKKELSDWDATWAKKNKKANVIQFDEDLDQSNSDDDMHVGYNHPLLRSHAIRTAAAKLQGTYVVGLLERVNPVTHRIHPGFNQCGAVATGRFSSVAPNFQNMPNKDKLADLGLGAYDIRSMLLPADGCDFIISDYSGIELAILAAMSGDENLIYQVLEGDVHSFVANSLVGDDLLRLYGTKLTKASLKANPDLVTIRKLFKPVSFGIVYGSTGYNLYRTLYFGLANRGIQITQSDADRWVERWKNELFPQTGTLLTRNSEYAALRFYTESVLGRRRRWSPDIRQDKWRMLAAMREGSNQPIQSSSADMTKLAMIKVDAAIDLNQARIVACIHDELLLESRKDYTDECMQITKELMEQSGRELFPYADPRLFVAEPKKSDRYDK